MQKMTIFTVVLAVKKYKKAPNLAVFSHVSKVGLRERLVYNWFKNNQLGEFCAHSSIG